MRMILRKVGWLIATVLACSVGTLPSCSSMGGGMRNMLSEPASVAVQDVAI
jgi:hypothetical protein